MCSASPTLSKPSAELSGGQQLLQIDVDAEQVADGVLVLDAVEPPQDDAALGLLPDLLDRDDVPVDPGDQAIHLGLARTGLGLRRHVAGRDLLPHEQPLPPRRIDGEVDAQVSSRIFPFALSGPWQSTQCFTRKGLIVRA